MKSTSEAAQAELIDFLQSIRVLPVVLDDIYIVGGGEETCESGGLGVPQRR